MKTLIIEDDAETATFIAAGLQSRGHEPRLAADGREGFELAAQETFDVIILDRMLPGLDGLSVVALLRGEGVSTPVLFLTNLSGVDGRVEGLGAGGERLSRQAVRLRGAAGAPLCAGAASDPRWLAHPARCGRPRS